MADFEHVWAEEDAAKRARTLVNPVRLVRDVDVCAEARQRIIELNAEIRRLTNENAQLKQAK